MNGKLDLIYWDTSVFLHYMEKTPQYIGDLDAILDEVARSRGTRKIVTSMLAKTEAAFVAQERDRNKLLPTVEPYIDSLWNDDSVIALVEVHDGIALQARRLMREGLPHGWRLKPPDAIHIASAIWLKAKEIHTYEATKWQKYSTYTNCPICEPSVSQLSMPT